MKPPYIDIDGRRYLWADLLELRRGQLAGWREAQQPTLFELRLDIRSHAERTTGGRYLQPGLFER